MYDVVNIVGARPQFIKYFPISKKLEIDGNINDILIHTGQHYDYEMSKIFFDEFGIKKPEYHLEIGSGTHGKQTGRIIEKIEEILQKINPQLIIVYGDTNTTIGASLAASKLHIPIAHIEAGLRSNNKLMPEEQNRVITDHVSTLLLCPSTKSVNNLHKEGFKNYINGPYTYESLSNINISIDSPLVANVGDVMYDVIKFVEDKFDDLSVLNKYSLYRKKYSIITIHRAENTDNIETFKKLINFVAENLEGNKVIFPIHPRTKKIIDESRIHLPESFRLIEPLGYFAMIALLKNALMLFTDSGGMQKESYWLNVPCVTLREQTEWVETVETGWNVLFEDYYKGHFNSLSKPPPIYGNGRSAKKITNLLELFLNNF